MADEREYLAKPAGECCLKGSLHEGEPRGTYTSIADVETYMSTPPKDKTNGHVVMYFADVWGMSPNSLLVMDGFADAGYLTLGLDYFRGDPVWKHRKSRDDKTTDPGFDFEAWKTKHAAFASEKVPVWIKAVIEHYGKPGTKFACVGYCFGAPYVCDALASNDITAGAFAHPTALKDHHFENITKPLFLSCAETDQRFPTESRNKAVDILIEHKKTYHVQLFSGVAHGFALRGNMENPYEKWAKEQSFAGIVEWFKLWLS